MKQKLKKEYSRFHVFVDNSKKFFIKLLEKTSVIVMLIAIDIFVWAQVHEDATPVFAWIDTVFASETITIEPTQKTEEESFVEEKEEIVWTVAEFSAYTARVEETDADPTTMASGKTVYVGAIACPAQYEFGTEIEIRGMGIYVCEDRMNIRYRHGEYFDIFFQSYNDAIQFGRQTLEYRVK
jgi:3D (Asp-Asp-Asp) domain-containing protein